MLRLLHDSRPPRLPAEVIPCVPSKLRSMAERGPLLDAKGRPTTLEKLWGFTRVEDHGPRIQNGRLPDHVVAANEAQLRAYGEQVTRNHARVCARLRAAHQERLARTLVRIPTHAEKSRQVRAQAVKAKAEAEQTQKAYEEQGWRFVDGIPVFPRYRPSRAVKPKPALPPPFVLPELEEPEPDSLFEVLVDALAGDAPEVEVELTAEELIAAYEKPAAPRELPQAALDLPLVAPDNEEARALVAELVDRPADTVVPGEGEWRQLKSELVAAKARGDTKTVRSVSGKLGNLVRRFPGLKVLA